MIKCPKCGSDEIVSYDLVIGRAMIYVKTWEVDEAPDHCEPWGDISDLDSFECCDCNFEFGHDGKEVKSC
ncbi:hypothetical protein [Alkalihalobacillus sp. BA299]|uniref:hypothetical protein n=1 Tax=Alkalihalobacillus sp. BA299 TaxID=2815938 RepID=UPI001ADAE1EC|nr:hypothetical protein [Alkalihalobacillus sp. BA299]